MDNQTLLKHKISNSLMVSVIHNFNQYLHLNASLISSSISPSWISLDVLLLLSLTDWRLTILPAPPCHQPDQLIEGDAAVTILVHLSYQLLQLSLWWRPAECSHDLAQLHGSDGSPSVPGHRSCNWLQLTLTDSNWPVKKREDFPELQHFVIRKSINRLQ